MNVSSVVSVHFPKAAGSSLHKQFSAHVSDKLLLDYEHDPLTPAGSERASFPVGRQIVHGHFRAARYDAPDAYFMTFLREPVNNLISIYYFWTAWPECGNPIHSHFLRERPSILDFAKYKGIARLMSETYFGGFDMSRFQFIGFYENRQNDLVKLAADLGFPLDSDFHVNRTSTSDERQELMQDRRMLDKLRDALRDDVKFYEAVVESRR